MVWMSLLVMGKLVFGMIRIWRSELSIKDTRACLIMMLLALDTSINWVVINSMFPIISILILGFFAIGDYLTQTGDTKWMLAFFLTTLPLKIITNTLLQSAMIAAPILFLMLVLQKLKVTYGGDTLVIALVTFIHPNPFVVLGGLTIGSLLATTNKNDVAPFLPYFFVGYLLVFLTFLLFLV